MTQVTLERTEKALSVADQANVQSQAVKAAKAYHKSGFGVKGKVVAQGRVVKFGPFTLAIPDGEFEGLEYVVYQAPDGVLQAELVEPRLDVAWGGCAKVDRSQP